MKKLIILIGSLLVIAAAAFIVINVTDNNKKVGKEDTYNTVTDGDIRYAGLADIRENADNVITSLKNSEYDNISAGDIKLVITDSDKVSCINISMADPIGKDRTEILEIEKKLIEYYLGDDLKEEYLFDGTTYLLYEEVKSAIEAGTYKPITGIDDANPFLGYTLEAEYLKEIYEKSKAPDFEGEYKEQKDIYKESEYKYAHVHPNLATVWVNKGKIYGIEEAYHWAPPDEYFEITEEYRINQMNRDKEIKLSNGSITLGDAVDFTEDYFETKLPYKTNKDVKKVVDGVKVLNVSDDVNILKFRLVRSYNGLLFEGGEEGEGYTEIPKYEKDMSYAYMVDTDDLDIYYGVTSAIKVEEDGKPVKKCVALDSALQLVAQSIGKNSEYEVKGVESIYRIKRIDESEGKFYGIPCWKISGVNKTSGQEINFYVEMTNGKLDYEEIGVVFDEEAFEAAGG